MTSDAPAVALVVPCYNEATRLDVATFEAYLGAHADVSVIFVDDGSTDPTSTVLEGIREKHPQNALVLRCAVNGGKAEAVRQGMLRALETGARYIGYWDADLATPLDEVSQFRHVLEQRQDVELLLGARIRLLGREIERKPLRHYLGRVFATGASLCLNLPVYDTQCGAKLFRVAGHTRSLFEKPFGSRWIFDVELLARHMAHKGSRAGLYEHSLASWRDVGESKVKPMDFARGIGDLLRIYRGYALGQPLRGPVLMLTSVFSIYALVGALGTVVHYLTLIIGVEAFKVAKPAAAVAGATLGALTNYVMNYHLTFTSSRKHKETLPRFALIAALAATLSWSGARFAERVGLNYLIAQLGCTVIVLVVGFFLNRYWTFAARS